MKSKLLKNLLIFKHSIYGNSNLSFLIVSVILGAITPPTITWDSYLYLGSGYGILHGLMSTQYHWLREPGYPFFVQVLSFVGNLQLVVIVQTLFIMISILLVYTKIESKFNLTYTKLIRNAAVLITFICCWGFGSTILQQSCLLFLTALLLYVLASTFANKYFFYASLSIILLFIQLVSSVYYFGALLTVTLALLFKERFTWKFLTHQLIIIIAIAIPSLTTFGIWENFKNYQTKKNELYQDATEFWNAQPYNHFDLEQKLVAVPSTFMGLNSLGVEFYYSNFQTVGSEMELFGVPSFSQAEKCGKEFPGPTYYVEHAKLPNLATCTHFPLALSIEDKFKFVQALIPIFSWCGFIVIASFFVTNFRRRQYQCAVLALLPMTLESPYLVSNGAISRLGFPTTAIFILLGALYFCDYISASVNSLRKQ